MSVNVRVALVSVENIVAAAKMLQKAKRAIGNSLYAFEFLDHASLSAVQLNNPDIMVNFKSFFSSQEGRSFVLLETAGMDKEEM